MWGLGLTPASVAWRKAGRWGGGAMGQGCGGGGGQEAKAALLDLGNEVRGGTIKAAGVRRC